VANPSERLDVYLNEVTKSFPPKVQEALRMIGNPALQLLALRRYINKGKGLDAQWVWSDEEIRAYKASPKAAREVEKVTRKFEELNPGYTLAASPIRDLNTQVALWNRNNTVHAAAEDLKRKCLQEIVTYPDHPDRYSADKFRTFLEHSRVHPEPTSAAPGLSDHGQMHAIDFVVIQGHRKIADTVTATIAIQWDAPGWTQKLKDAVTLSKSLFIGPLQFPREPWHYRLAR